MNVLENYLEKIKKIILKKIKELNILKKKKVVTNIKFLSEDDVKDDALAWNCLNRNKYSKTD